jgi:hypothetical protein
MKAISDHIKYIEATKSETAIRKGIKNKPGELELKNMRLVAEKCFEPIRDHFDVPIYISSFFRSKELNLEIGGSDTSDHCLGRAIDVDADIFNIITNKDIFTYALRNLEFDQLIWEYGDLKNPAWVHMSYRTNNRNMILQASKSGYTELSEQQAINLFELEII